MENAQTVTTKPQPLLKNKEFLSSLIYELLFYIYISFFSVTVLSMLGDIEIITHEGKREVQNNMPNSTLAFFLMLAFVMEIIGFIKIPASKAHKTAIIIFTTIPRLFLFWEVTRILMISFTHEITTAGSILLFFSVPLLLITTLVIFSMKRERKTEDGNAQKWNLEFLYFLPFYCLWYTLFEQVYLPDLWSGDWFVFIGLYSVFMYFPLRLPSIIQQIRSKSMSKWKIALLVIQPIVVYFMVYQNLQV